MEPAKINEEDARKARVAYEQSMARALAAVGQSAVQPPVASASASPAAPAIPPTPQTPPQRERGEDASIAGDLGGRGYDYGNHHQSQGMPGNWIPLALLVFATAIALLCWQMFKGTDAPKKYTPAELIGEVRKTDPVVSPVASAPVAPTVSTPIVSAVATTVEPLGENYDVTRSTNTWGKGVAQALRVEAHGPFAIKVNGGFEICTNHHGFGETLINRDKFGERIAEVSETCEAWLKGKPDVVYQIRTFQNAEIRIFFEKRR